MKEIVRSVGCASALLVGFTTGTQAEDFYPISGITSATAATDLWPASNLIQGPGVGFAADAPNAKLLAGEAGNWVTAAPGGFPSDYIAAAGKPALVLDLGSDQSLSSISVWGYESSNANGVSAFSLRFATAAEGTAGFGTSISYAPSFSGLGNADTTLRQSFAFDNAVSARYVEFVADDNFFLAPGDGSTGGVAGGDRVGLGEIAFPVPETSPLALIALGGLTFFGIRRLRHAS